MDDVTLPNCQLARGQFFSHGGHLVVVGSYLIVGGSSKVVLDGWWSVVMVRNPGGGDEAEDVWCCCCCCCATTLANYDTNDRLAKIISFAKLPKKDFANPGRISSQSFWLRNQNH